MARTSRLEKPKPTASGFDDIRLYRSSRISRLIERIGEMEATATDTSSVEVRIQEDKPPAWANNLMKWDLTTPGLQAWVGRQVALLGFTGRKTGNSYTIPVSYQRDRDTVTVVTKKLRRWWKNFETPAEVELRLAGRMYQGKAEVVAIDQEALEFMTHYLERRPIDAKAYGLDKDEITEEKIAGILPHIVVIRIEVASVA